MAARINPAHDENTRAKIKTSQLVNRLNQVAKGEADCSPTQLRAAEILLRKTLPDLSAISLTGVDGGPVQIQSIRREIVDPKHKNGEGI